MENIDQKIRVKVDQNTNDRSISCSCVCISPEEIWNSIVTLFKKLIDVFAITKDTATKAATIGII